MNIPKVVKVEQFDENGKPLTTTTEATTETTTVQTTQTTTKKQETTTQKVIEKPTETTTKAPTSNGGATQPKDGDINSAGIHTWVDGFGWVEGLDKNATTNVEKANLSQYSKDGTMGEIIGH